MTYDPIVYESMISYIKTLQKELALSREQTQDVIDRSVESQTIISHYEKLIRETESPDELREMLDESRSRIYELEKEIESLDTSKHAVELESHTLVGTIDRLTNEKKEEMYTAYAAGLVAGASRVSMKIQCARDNWSVRIENPTINRNFVLNSLNQIIKEAGEIK